MRPALRSSRSERRRETPGSKHAGGHRIRVTPVPIPNTEVKPDTADGTARETVWESRSLPAVIPRPDVSKTSGLFSLGQMNLADLQRRALELVKQADFGDEATRVNAAITELA